MRRLALLLPLLALPLGAAEAQWREQPIVPVAPPVLHLAPGPRPPQGDAARRDPERVWRRALLPAAAGSVLGVPVGVVAGFVFYEATGCCFEAGDDPGLGEALLGGLAGAAVGSSLGAYLTGTRDRPVSFGRALLGAALGVVPAAYLGAAAGNETSVWVGFSVFGLTHALATVAGAATTPQPPPP
jgi:hypothetical protein